ncbi:uncharacterized protein LOC114520285 [Dendronephthya gigantea]|uniref:uncharacterized protein LOC114520285 n=1 Tax=Dendronephthya gigantea TaxID=151771 RepID=UPI00106A10E6|nr:uncharacterized protein LOC114520285 [Dendronephthya gigantea]
MNEAETACVQLGYERAVGLTGHIASGPTNYHLDEVKCNPSHARIQDCDHDPWGDHDCGNPPNQKTSVSCSGGYREVIAKTHEKATHYWNCDEFTTGQSYDIKNGHSARIHGTATLSRSPIDSGFHLKGKSSWVNLGDFSSQPCLVDPHNCFIGVSVWLKALKLPSHTTYVLGNRYSGHKMYGFYVYISGGRLRGEIRGSQTYCYFHDYRISTNFWYHFTMTWAPGASNFNVYMNGNPTAKRKCLATENTTQHNPVYTLGADEALAGNSNRDLDVSFDDLVILFQSWLSDSELKAPYRLATQLSGHTVTEITLKVPDYPWNSAYNDKTSSVYTELVRGLDDLTSDIYDHEDFEFVSYHLKSLQANSGVLQMSLGLNFTKAGYVNGFRLFRSINEHKFLNTTAEVIGCKPQQQSCDDDIILESAVRDKDPTYAGAYFYPKEEHLKDPYYRGYIIVAYKVNGSKWDVWTAHSYPDNLNRAHARVKCGAYKLVAVTVQLMTMKGYGFRCSNFKMVELPEGSPTAGPSGLTVKSHHAFNVTVVWGNITEYHRMGIIQKYAIRLRNGADLRRIIRTSCCVWVNETHTAYFDILHPGVYYHISVCGYTSYHVCGTNSYVRFRATPLLPARAPRDAIVTPHPSKAHLRWKIVHPDYQYGTQIKYRVVVEKLRTKNIVYSLDIGVTDDETVDYECWLWNLRGLTEYRVNVSLINEVGEGPVNSVFFETTEGVPSAYPENFAIVNITSDTINATWEAIHPFDTNGILRGYHLYYRLADFSGPWSVVNVANLTASVPVLSLRPYELQLCGFTNSGDGVNTSVVIVNTTGFRPTNVSTDITVVNATNDTMSIHWSYDTIHSKPAQYFIITVTRNDTNVTVAIERLNVLFWFEDVFWIIVKGLKEYKWYKIRVAAGNIKGTAPFSDMLVLNHTLEGLPSAPPRNLTAMNTSSRSILLQWKPVVYEYQDGIIRGYKVFWRLANTADSWNEVQVNGSHNTNTEIKRLKKFRDYEFKILAFTTVGNSVMTKSVVARTDEDIPLHPPLNVHTYNTSSRSLQVIWDRVPAEWRFGIIRGYQVIITDTRDGHEYVEDVKFSANRSLERAGFERYTNYTVKVAAYTVKGLGNFSEAIRVITDEDVPSEPPPDIQCTTINSTTLKIDWSVLAVVKAHGIVRTYVTFLNRSDGRHIELYRDVQPATSFTTSFHGLDEYVKYSVEMLATTIKGEGVKSVPITCETDEDVPHASPQGLHGFNTSDTTIKIFWKLVPIDDQNGIITGYTIFFNTTRRNGDINHREKRVGLILQTNLDSLLPFKYYDIQIAAWTSKGMGPKSNVTTILTEEEAPKVAPSNVKAFNTSSTSIRLTWRAIPPEQVGGILRGYKIFWDEVDYLGNVILQNETRLDSPSYESLDFTGLTKFQEYRFSILAFTKFDGVLSAVVSTMTDQDIPTLPPTACSGFNVSKNKIKIVWNDVPRSDRNGIILGYNIYTTEVYNYFATMPADYIAPDKRTIMNTTEEPARLFVQHRLLPYTDYSFKVDAFTSKGNGPNCSAFIVRTEEEAPLVSPGNITLYNTSSTSIEVNWFALNQNIIRGIFFGYEIWFTAHPEFPSAYLRYGDPVSKRKRRSVFTLDKQSVTAGVTSESIKITGLAKYTNYTVQVIGYTKFLGAQSQIVRVLTDEDIPSKPPRDLRGHNLSSTTISIKWRTVEDGFVHGILLGYRLYYRLTVAPLMPPFNKTFGPEQYEATIDGLFMFTNYTFQITAFTSKGEGPLCNEVVISTDEDVASKSPFGFSVVNLIHMHEIPLSWNPVPEGYLNGILIGYRIKMWLISDAMLDVAGEERHIDVDAETLSYTVRKLLNFATYRFQIVALTKYGEGVHSPIKTAKTCPCEKYLTTNWYMLPPYTNRTGDKETGILPWLLNNLVKECCGDCSNGHRRSEILYKTDGYGQDGFKEEIGDFSTIINTDTDFHFPVLGHHLQEKFQTFYSYVYAVASPGVAFFIVDDPPDTMPNAILQTVSGSWGMMFFTVVFSFMAGIVMWILDAGENESEFTRRFFTGCGEGFWWAFVTMTTVGYGDRSPRSFAARVFTMFWMLTGLIITSILMGNITNALTTVTFTAKSIKLYGTKVAAIEGSPSFRVGIRRNAIVNPDNKYLDAFGLQRDLRERKVKGALLDGYMAGSYNELFEEDHIRVKEIIDFNAGYGFVLGGIHHRLQRCFKSYVKRKRSFIVDYVASQIKVVKKNPKSPAEAQSTNLFNPKADIFVKSMTVTLAMYVGAIVIGFCLQFYLRKRFRKKVRDSTEANYKQIPKDTGEMLESFCTRISALKKELYDKHTNELRVMSGMKRREVSYDILPNINEDFVCSLSENADVEEKHSSCSDSIHDNKFTSKTLLIPSPSYTGETIGNGVDQSRLPSPAMQSQIQLDLSSDIPSVDESPDIEDLQREAYLAGLKAEGKDESGHPFAQWYRYLWVEK